MPQVLATPDVSGQPPDMTSRSGFGRRSDSGRMADVLTRHPLIPNASGSGRHFGEESASGRSCPDTPPRHQRRPAECPWEWRYTPGFPQRWKSGLLDNDQYSSPNHAATDHSAGINIAPTNPTQPDPARAALVKRVNDLSAQCGMSGNLGEPIADGWIDESPPAGGADLVNALRTGSRKRARETLNLDRAGTALEWMAEFVTVTGRTPFVPLAHASDLAGSVYNSETLEMLAGVKKR